MGWLLGIVDEGRIQDLEGAVLDLTKPLPPDAFARYDGVIAGIAKVRGTEAAVFAQEPSYKGGSMGLGHTRRLEKLVSVATDEKLPIIGFYDSGGVRVQEGGHSLEEASALVGQLIKARDVVPVISAVMGTVSGAAAYAAYMGDAILMIRGKSSLFVWGPGVARAETNTEVTAEELGGADVQSANGTASHVLDDERECLETAARLLGYFRGKGSGQPLEATPSTPQLITQTFDPGSFVEFRGSYARSAVTGLALLEGKTVGVVSSNKEVMRGFLDVDACRKISRFASMCNSLRIPLVTLLDSPGVYPGPEQEKAGVIRASGEAIKEYASSGSPKVAVITGEAYGGAFVGFASKALGSKKVFAYPTARISVLSLPAYSEIFLKKRVDALAGEAKQTELDRGSTDYLKQMDPSKGVREGYIDEIIDPSQTRAKLVEAFKGAGVF
ncbi:MAG TPA: carboxyl transferase domain-containing protein [Nitrososphaerales archaeon]|nr:carboxyl transferase domain-containing protein [Nitrososphaerales archaeon]